MDELGRKSEESGIFLNNLFKINIYTIINKFNNNIHTLDPTIVSQVWLILYQVSVCNNSN